MSRVIDLTKSLSKADRAYLTRRGRLYEIDRADKAAGATESARDSESTPEASSARSGGTGGRNEVSEEIGPVEYGKMTVPQLKQEMDKRREKYETEGDSEGVELMSYASDARKDDLVAALNMDDEEEDEDSDEE